MITFIYFRKPMKITIFYNVIVTKNTPKNYRIYIFFELKYQKSFKS